MGENKTRRAPVEVPAEPPEHDPDASETPQAGDPAALAPRVEAVLLTLDRPATPGRLAEGLGLRPEDNPVKAIEAAVELLNEQYEATERSFRIERVAGGLRMMTTADQAESVGAFHAARAGGRLSRAAIETLAIIAYRQPITRVELEAIRGVACGEVLRTLLDRRLAAIVGRAEELGRPMLYGTSRRFLEVFGLSSLKDLPPVGDLSSLVEPPPTPPADEPNAEPQADRSGEEASSPDEKGDAPDESAPDEAASDDDDRTDGA
jgi:segregation and condensation protein B